MGWLEHPVRTQARGLAVVRTPPVGCERCAALIRLLLLALLPRVELPAEAVLLFFKSSDGNRIKYLELSTLAATKSDD